MSVLGVARWTKRPPYLVARVQRRVGEDHAGVEEVVEEEGMAQQLGRATAGREELGGRSPGMDGRMVGARWTWDLRLC